MASTLQTLGEVYGKTAEGRGMGRITRTAIGILKPALGGAKKLPAKGLSRDFKDRLRFFLPGLEGRKATSWVAMPKTAALHAITEKLVSKQKLVTPTGATAAKDPVDETKGWATYEKKVPIEAKRADKGGTLRTLEGPARYSRGDMIARGAKGEKWPIRKDVFAKTYGRSGPAFGFAKAAMANIGSRGVISRNALRRGMQVDLEHQRGPETDVAKGDPKTFGRIAWAHLKERPDYYSMLEKAEKKAGGSGATSPQSFGVFSPRAAAYLSHPRITRRFQSKGFSQEASAPELPRSRKVA